MLQETPSVQFQLQDQNQVSQAATVNQVMLQFSNTIRKDQNMDCDDTKEIKKILTFENITPTPIEPQIFFQEFDNNFIVQFENEESELIEQTTIYPLSHPNAFGNRNGIVQHSHFNLSNTIESALQEKQIKSQIITKKKGFPCFQIRQRKVVKNKQSILENKLLPNTCRNYQNKEILCFTSKVTPQDTKIAKKMLNKYEKGYERIQNKSLFQLNNKIKDLWPSKNPEKITDSLPAVFRKTNNQEKRANIFLKLPLLK